MSDLYRLIYTSRDLISGDADQRQREIEQILRTCRRNNRRDGVTGALLLGTGLFAQILEGRRAAVEATFERIQCDVRHSDIVVLQCEPVESRNFPNWDMALAGRSEQGRLLWKDLSRGAAVDLSRLDGDSLCATVLAMVQADERTSFPDQDRLSAEIGARRRLSLAVSPAADAPPPAADRTGPAPTQAPASGVGDDVLRAALDEERGRTTVLRRELDDARIALARAASEAEALGRQRDIWADRSTQLRSSLRDARAALTTAAAERDGLTGQLASCEPELGLLRVQRNLWADCARALAAALSAETAAGGATRDGAGAPERERPPLRRVSG